MSSSKSARTASARARVAVLVSVGWASAEADPVELEGLLDAIEIELVKEWLKNRKKA